MNPDGILILILPEIGTETNGVNEKVKSVATPLA